MIVLMEVLQGILLSWNLHMFLRFQIAPKILINITLNHRFILGGPSSVTNKNNI